MGERPLWTCENGHETRWVLKSEALGREACPSCYAPVASLVIEEDDTARAGAGEE